MVSTDRDLSRSSVAYAPRFWRRLAGAAPLILVVAGLLAYANSFWGHLVFDDFGSIARNSSISQLWPPWDILTYRSAGETASARPVLNLTLAVNHAISGTDPWSYHALNLLVHLAAGLFLWGIVWRTWLRASAAGPPDLDRGIEARVFGLIVALLWTLHPLQTESVTYIVQRAESMMGMFFLASLYGLIRAAENPKSRWWPLFSAGMCLLGVGTKEVIAMAPPLLLLFDRVFLAGSFRDAWNLRRRLHAALFATWAPLAGLVIYNGGNRGGSMGFGVASDIAGHLLAQFVAVARYVRLSLWPHPQVFDYGLERFGWVQLAAAMLFASGIALAILWSWRRRPALAFLGLWFLAILAPASLMPSPSQTTAEHRVYLSLAAVMLLVVLGLRRLLGARFAIAGLMLAIAAATATHVRNRVYALYSTDFWEAIVIRHPENANAQYNYGVCLVLQKRFEESLAPFEFALKHGVGRSTAAAHNNYLIALVQVGRKQEAIEYYGTASAPFDDGTISLNLGLALFEAGEIPQALALFGESVRLNPKSGQAWSMQGACLVAMGRITEGIERYEQSLRAEPGAYEPLNNLGLALMRNNLLTDAAARFEEAAAARPESPEVHVNLGILRARTGQYEESARQFREALKLKPDDVATRSKLGMVLAQAGQTDAAFVELNKVVQIAPDDLAAHSRLATLHEAAGRPDDAARHREIADRIRASGP